MCGVIAVAEGLRKNLVVYMSLREVGWKEIMLVISSWLDIWGGRRLPKTRYLLLYTIVWWRKKFADAALESEVPKWDY